LQIRSFKQQLNVQKGAGRRAVRVSILRDPERPSATEERLTRTARAGRQPDTCSASTSVAPLPRVKRTVTGFESLLIHRSPRAMSGHVGGLISLVAMYKFGRVPRFPMKMPSRKLAHSTSHRIASGLHELESKHMATPPPSERAEQLLLKPGAGGLCSTLPPSTDSGENEKIGNALAPTIARVL